ncbi:pentapeptide repeat-containing protein [Nocardiopsis ansamitocini]|uniref:pentapeptide repeat-containing protein n=1 Tax=Nocardiopsis ansamitocini TaxID=1670832 RepID=UPI002553294D|nr:pentapeptide repeat-containing protein [Nocardiopsis ansamitocini]
MLATWWVGVWRRFGWWVGGPLAVVGALAVLLFVLFPMTWWVAGPTVYEGLAVPELGPSPSVEERAARATAAKENAAAVNAVRQTLLQGFGGTAALTALVFTARSYLLNQRGQYTQRYKDAIEQLSSEQMAARIGGIYALEHVMRESERDHETVVEVLAAFVRENAPRNTVTPQSVVSSPWGQRMHPPTGVEEPAAPVEAKKGPPTDVQTALTVIGRRPKRPEKNRVDLSNTNLQQANLRRANLQNANLREANLQNAYLTEADLQEADLREANLQNARVGGVNLQNGNLYKTNLKNAKLGIANLQNANLREANLQNAYIRRAVLQHAYLDEAKLDYADLRGATGVDLTGVASQEGVVLDSDNGKPFGDGSG